MNELIFNNKNKIGIVFSEAGGSNLILGWILENKNLKFQYCLTGAAIKIFEKHIGNFVNLNIDEVINKSDVMIIGRNIYGDLEHKARSKAKEKEILQVCVLDHWVNFEGCFTRNGETILPNFIWVFDKYAEKKAINIFKETPVIKQTNYYLQNILKRIEKLSSTMIKTKDNNVLYLLEPIRKNFNEIETNHEFKVLDYFFDNLWKLKLKNIKIRLRPHPSDPKNKYEKWLENNNRDYDISISKYQSIESDIAWSDTVVGYETYALVIGKAASKRCITSIPNGEPNCRLMIKDIEYLRDIK